ncbi:MAG: hypothetical protein NTZ64_14575 [Polaromonas sp.]|nr:hypothetical protein [Polaromonas sp.]
MNTARPSDGASAFSGAGAPEALLPAASPVSPVSDLMIHRLQRALRERVRYRYVEPLVLREGESFRIQSPCCSRNVDPSGGLIDIALLTPGPVGADGVAGAGGDWSLSARDHAAGVWRACLSDAPLELLLDALCVDSERQFWP